MAIKQIITGMADRVRQEYLIESVSDVQNLSVSVPTGSVAYTADLSNMYMFDGDEWIKIGG